MYVHSSYIRTYVCTLCTCMLHYVVSTYVRKYVAKYVSTTICAYVHTCIIPCTICTYF